MELLASNSNYKHCHCITCINQNNTTKFMSVSRRQLRLLSKVCLARSFNAKILGDSSSPWSGRGSSLNCQLSRPPEVVFSEKPVPIALLQLTQRVRPAYRWHPRDFGSLAGTAMGLQMKSQFVSSLEAPAKCWSGLYIKVVLRIGARILKFAP